MTFRQTFLKLLYPLIRKAASLAGKSKPMTENTNHTQPNVSFYNLSVTLNSGSELNFSQLKGKKVLLVNTASDCGYTAQYAPLQELFEAYADKLVIIAFPANDFGEQEKGNDEDIAVFCKLNFGVSFPVAKKSTVVKNSNQHPVFQWLTNAEQNGWCNQQPQWNFNKYLINEAGVLTHYFPSSADPMSDIKPFIEK